MKKTFTRLEGGVRSFMLVSGMLLAGTGIIQAQSNYSVSPNPGEVSALERIVLQWGDSKLAKDAGEITLTVDGVAVANPDVDVFPGRDGIGMIMPGAPGTITITYMTSDPGEYVFTIPSGYVTIMNTMEQNEEIVLKYTISDNASETPGGIPTPTITPSSGTSLEMVTIDWGIPIEESFNSTYASVEVSGPGGVDDYVYFVGDYYVEGNKLIISINDPYTTEGEYTITINEDTVTFPTLGDEANPLTTLKYTVKAEGTGGDDTVNIPTPTMTPSSGSSLEMVTIDWGLPIEESFNSNFLSVGIDTPDGNNALVYFIGEYYVEDNKLIIYVDDPFTDEGEYTITINEDTVTFPTLGDEPNPLTILKYTVKAGGTGGEDPEPGDDTVYPVSITPANGSKVENLKEVTMTWDSKYQSVFLSYQGTATIEFDGVSEGLNIEDFSAVGSYPNSAIRLTLNSDIIAKDGKYTITIPKGFIEVKESFMGGDTYYNPELILEYTVEGTGTGGGDEEPTGVQPASVDPVDGSEVEVLQTVTLTWNYLRIAKGAGTATIEHDGQVQDLADSQVAFKNGSSNILTGESTPASLTLTLNATEAGDYTVKLPAGFAQVATTSMGPSDTTAAIELHYTVTGGEVAAPEYSVNPQPGTVGKLGEVTLQWGSSMLTQNGGEITLKINEEAPINITDKCDFFAGTESMWGGLIPGTPGRLTLNFDPAYTAQGTYVITIPKGYVTVNDASAPNGEIELTYTVTGESFVEPVPTVTPANNSEVESLSTVTIDWGIAIEEGPNMDSWSSTITILKDDDYYAESEAEGYIEGGKLVLYLYPEITEEGKYEIVIPDDYVIFSNQDASNSEFSLTYTVKEGGENPGPVDPDPEGDYTIVPAPTTTPMAALPEEVKIYFGDRTETVNVIAQTAATIQVGDAAAEVITDKITADYDEIGSGWDLEYLYYAAIDLSDYADAKENVTITIPAGFFNIGGYTILGSLYGGEPSAEIVITYILDLKEGIHGINADADGLYRVYNLQGVNVLTTPDAIELNRLAKGLYIVNGKKLIIR